MPLCRSFKTVLFLCDALNFIVVCVMLSFRLFVSGCAKFVLGTKVQISVTQNLYIVASAEQLKILHDHDHWAVTL